MDNSLTPISKFARSELLLPAAIALGALAASGWAAPLQAKTRSCDAGYVATNTKTGAQFVFGEFVARGSCSGNGDKCRERARSAAKSCMAAHWRERWEGATPAACKTGSVERYNVINLKSTIETNACALGWARDETAEISLAGHTKGQTGACGSRTTHTSSYRVTPEMCAANEARPARPPSGREGQALIIPANDTRDPVSGYDFPASMPKIRYPKGYHGCTAAQKTHLQKTWAMAFYMVWISDMAMDWMKRKGQYRKAAWDHTFRNPATNDYINYAPRAWFGPMNDESFGEARGVIKKLWEKRMTGKTFTVKCRADDRNQGPHPCFASNPGGNGRPGANHIIYGTINFCASAFGGDRYSGARRVVHELLHWMTSPKGFPILDTHTHCHSGGGCTTDKGYGRAKAHHLSNYDGGSGLLAKRRRVGHRKRALRNNDNYAWFIHDFGRHAWDKNWDTGLPKLTQFPSAGFRW